VGSSLAVRAVVVAVMLARRGEVSVLSGTV
jgi:hypothetical protein